MPWRRGLLGGIASDASLRLRLGEGEIDLLAARLASFEPVELLAALDRRGRQLVEHARRLLGLDDDHLTVPPVPDLRCRRPADELLDGAGGDDPPLAEDGDAVCELLDLVQIVRRQEDRLAERAQGADRLPGPPPGAGIEAGRRLVQEDQLGIADEREAEIEPAPLAAGEPARAGVALLFEPDQPDHFVDRPGALVVAGELGELLGNGEVLVHGGGLEHDADAGAPVEAGVGRIDAEHLYLPAVASPVALKDLNRRRLAGSVRAEQAEDLARTELELDALQRFELAVRLRQAVNADDRGHEAESSSVREVKLDDACRREGRLRSVPELGRDLAAVGLVADHDDDFAASGNRRLHAGCGGARRERVAGLARAGELARNRVAGLAGAKQRARQDDARSDPSSSESFADRAGLVAAFRREPAQLIGPAGFGVGVADQEDAH